MPSRDIRTTEVYLVDQRVKGRPLMATLSLVCIVLGLIVLAHEIAICVLNTTRLGKALTAAQIIATIAAGFAVLAGLAASSPSTANAALRTLRRNFIIAAVVSFLATILLCVAVGLFFPSFWNLWSLANSDPSNPILNYQYTDPTYSGYSAFDTHVLPNQNTGSQYIATGQSVYDYHYITKVIAILKIVALIGESILLTSCLILTIFSVINVMRLKSNYQPAAVHDSAAGTRVYYEKN
ncbi:hypothetical protein RvY_19297 [Ramazzottius varieornatus]|uniref:MARVEL domain-containing protein n=1 Tax=Ramazzottius varieornatus TaxID=947166 RepID=A0A1D1WAV5_RAMVA|nr:hypothetical protein RvY_19297 [Ramazzottius varieornatus]